MKKALLVRRYGSLTSQAIKRIFPGWDVLSYGSKPPLRVREYDVIVVGFVEETQREMEWVEECQTTLKKGGRTIRIA